MTIELEKIAVKNIVVHRDSEISIEKGIQVVRGENGSGKSLLFNCIPNVFDGCPPLMKKKDAKAIHNGDSSIEIDYKYNNKSYQVIQKCEKGNISYDIIEDGKDLQPRTISIAKQYMEKIFPLSTDHYYSLVHITSYRPHTLLAGTGPQRKEFFEQLFRLNISDYVLDRLKEDFNQLKRERDEKQLLEEQIAESKFVDNIDSKKVRYKALTSKYQQLNDLFNKLTAESQSITKAETLRQQLKSKLSKDEINQKISQFEKRVQSLTEQLKQLNRDRATYEANERVKERKAVLSQQLAEFSDINLSAGQYKERYDQLKLRGIELHNTIQQDQQLRDKYEELQLVEQSIDSKILAYIKKHDKQAYLEKYAAAVSAIKEKTSLIAKLTDLSGHATCPTCCQPLNKQEIEMLISDCKQKMQKAQQFTSNHQSILQWYDLSSIDYEFVDVQDLQNQIAEIKQQMEVAKTSLTQAERKEIVQRQIDGLPEILNVQQPDQMQIEKIENSIEKGQGKIRDLKSDIKILDLLDQIIIPINTDQQALSQGISRISPRIQWLNEKRMMLHSQITVGQKENELYKRKLGRIKDIEKDIVDIPVYEALIKAYGAKGIRIGQIEFLAKAFCANLNKYANLVFNKKITFSVNVDSNNFNIFAERNGGQISDVSQLSGAEGRCFVLLCTLSLLPFIPENLRTDFIILDEIEAGMKKNTRDLISKEFFKALNQIVPKIVIVTPLDLAEYYIEADREYFLRLKNNSTVIDRIK